MLVLFETAAGYALFKLLDEAKLKEVDDLWSDFDSPEKANDIVKLVSFKRFKDTADAVEATSNLIEGKLGKTLKKMLKKHTDEQLAVADAKLGNLIKEKLSVQCVSTTATAELMRGIRQQLAALIAGELPRKELDAMSLGVAHSLSRYRLKFSPEKIDTMIVQAVSLLDDLDKELNNYVMRCREWYGWHFPELGKLVTDHQAFARVVKIIGMRHNTVSADLSDVLEEDVAQRVKEEAEISMGTEISEFDIANITELCDQIVEISKYRAQLYDYLKNRMMALAPNLTILLGELVAARLIAHAGTLMNLAKYPASTIQILGAEKALFRALKTRRDTPKYGLIYHAQLIGQTGPKLKGKMSRMLAAKAALACRVDALSGGGPEGEEQSSAVGGDLGLEQRAYLERRVKALAAQGTSRRLSGMGKAKAKTEQYTFKSEVMSYDAGADSTIKTSKKRKLSENGGDQEEEAVEEQKVTTTPSKKRKVKQETDSAEENETQDVALNGDQMDADAEETPKSEKKKKKKKKSKATSGEDE